MVMVLSDPHGYVVDFEEYDLDRDHGDVSRRWAPADGAYTSTYQSGPSAIEVNVNADSVIAALNGQLTELSVDQCRWLSARLAEAAGINEILRGIQSPA